MIFKDTNVVTVMSKKGFMLKCNIDFDVCSFDVGGWYFGKLAGILGTMNNEIYDDYTTSQSLPAKNDLELIESWKVNECSPVIQDSITQQVSDTVVSLCDSFFKRKTSYFTTCFDKIDPEAYYQMCLSLSESERYKSNEQEVQKGACTAAIAYIEACDDQKIPLRVPDVCIQ